MLTMQDALARLAAYWSEQGCLVVQPMNTEVGAGTLNPATALRVLGPEPWKVAYVEPSVRPDDARYGENPNRLQTHTQYQVILKPEPGNPQELYLGSLIALGIDIEAHDVRFVEDNWASPALGAWGLGWEVWLDGLEITQFTYFQQAGGQPLDPPSVEITYGMERILMALQGVRHFKDITYAPGLSYGELFGQAEYEMSRYYLDDADVAATRGLLDAFAAEAERLVEAGLPVPAHIHVLKMSHAFNVLDARGAVSTAERAVEFARMRRLSGAVAQLWVATRQTAGFPLLTAAGRAGDGTAGAPAADARPAANHGALFAAGSRTLLLEIGVEEMPPAEAVAARDQVESLLAKKLAEGRLAHGALTVSATPRRLVATVADVASREADATRVVRGPKVTAAFRPDGTPTPAAAGFARANGVEVTALARTTENGVEHLAVVRHERGRPATDALAPALADVVRKLRASKNMRWNNPELSFTRPIRWVVALLGESVVPIEVGGLVSGRRTTLVRVAPGQPSRAGIPATVELTGADAYTAALDRAGILLDAGERRERIAAAAARLAAEAGGHVDVAAESRLLDEVSFLVEQPTPILGGFDPGYLELPEAVLTTVMRKHQRYLPVRAGAAPGAAGPDDAGRLLPRFVAVANGTVDVDAVRAGNEAVLRARFEDAAFFYRADLKTPLAAMVERLSRLTFTDKLGSMADRAGRIATLAAGLAGRLAPGLAGADREVLRRASDLVKFDLGSQMVIELTSLAGTMAHEYAQAAGEQPAVATALLEAELPRSAGGPLPATVPGALLALADRLDALVGLAATVGLPTGSSDPFAVRRAALGALAILRTRPELAGLSLRDALAASAAGQPVAVTAALLDETAAFLARRLELTLVDEGFPVDHVRAVLPHADRPAHAERLARQLADLRGRDDFRAVAAALDRARRIVPAATTAGYDPARLTEPAELALHQSVATVGAGLAGLGAAPDLVSFTAATAPLVAPVNQFFDDILVMDPDPEIRATRLGLLATVRDLGAGVLDWSALTG
ncbi:glycyl-tRNA synthetase, beta subunit [Pseudofrankia inefficax]|uniref:Multifunctional fusion protein n=2 Tax=Pseudofrankia inefficax (strain DSM 45817 / CECT 9037 / DDB 130130 / EuI1c) TaxID=298654 RepID=E3J2Z2_PSEI1|nr:glycyl-tRNA synthetase, beta subunit [Pseudofrankia inefficax]